jgi:hypothetical protein
VPLSARAIKARAGPTPEPPSPSRQPTRARPIHKSSSPRVPGRRARRSSPSECLGAAVETFTSVEAGRHEADALGAVLGAAGHRLSRRREGRRACRRARSRSSGCSRGDSPNKEIAEWLVISPKTVADHADHPRRRSTPRPAPPQACSRCSTASCPRRSSPRASRPEPFSRPASPASSSS